MNVCFCREGKQRIQLETDGICGDTYKPETLSAHGKEEGNPLFVEEAPGTADGTEQFLRPPNTLSHPGQTEGSLLHLSAPSNFCPDVPTLPPSTASPSIASCSSPSLQLPCPKMTYGFNYREPGVSLRKEPAPPGSVPVDKGLPSWRGRSCTLATLSSVVWVVTRLFLPLPGCLPACSGVG